jgi:hypothetical protein
MSSPTDHHYQYALQIVDYLIAKKDLVLAFAVPKGLSNLTIDVFSKASPHQPGLGLHAYSDAAFADTEDRKSTSGYLFKFAGGTICHKSCKQNLVTTSTSTTEAEYVAITYAAKEATWLHRLLTQLGYFGKDTKPIKLYGDNQCCTLTGLSLPSLILHIYIAPFFHSYSINSVLHSPSTSHT